MLGMHLGFRYPRRSQVAPKVVRIVTRMGPFCQFFNSHGLAGLNPLSLRISGIQ